jgi:hypothetical protein
MKPNSGIDVRKNLLKITASYLIAKAMSNPMITSR